MCVSLKVRLYVIFFIVWNTPKTRKTGCRYPRKYNPFKKERLFLLKLWNITQNRSKETII